MSNRIAIVASLAVLVAAATPIGSPALAQA